MRWYPEHVVAETRVRGPFEAVGNTSFVRLVRYIGGQNTRSQKVAMTAPVIQEAEDEVAGRYVVSFVIPAGLDLQDAPEPTNRDVRFDPSRVPWFRRRNEVVVPVVPPAG